MSQFLGVSRPLGTLCPTPCAQVLRDTPHAQWCSLRQTRMQTTPTAASRYALHTGDTSWTPMLSRRPYNPMHHHDHEESNAMKRSLITLALSLSAIAPAMADQALASSKNCLACHAVDKKLVGPSFKD